MSTIKPSVLKSCMITLQWSFLYCFLFFRLLEKGVSLTYAQAKLFGMVDKAGKVRLPMCNNDYKHTMGKNNVKFLKKLSDSSTKPKKKIVTDDDIHCTFRPKKDPKALKAMKNSRCGYDFLNREETSNFLNRIHNTSERSQNKKDKYLEADYEAKLDKLVCPKCKKEQSYDEYKNKVRECKLCNQRFGPSLVISQQRFESKLKKNETKRLEKLSEVEKKVYEYKPFKARPAPKMTSISVSSVDVEPSLTPARDGCTPNGNHRRAPIYVFGIYFNEDK